MEDNYSTGIVGILFIPPHLLIIPGTSMPAGLITLILSEKEILESIVKLQEKAIIFVESGTKPKRSLIPKSLREKRSNESIGSKCPTCDRIITIANPPSNKQYDPIDSSLTIEHLFPLRLGGDNKLEELMVAMCHHCNSCRNTVMQTFLAGLFSITRQSLSGRQKEKVRRFVEWSIASLFLPEHALDDEIQGIWQSLQKEPDSVGKLLDKISNLEKRLEKLENTPWKRLTRFFGGIFRRKTKKPHRQFLTEPSEFPKLIFTPEDFAVGLLRQKNRKQPVTFTTLYDRLIKEDPTYNLKNLGIKPTAYLVGNCSDLLSIEHMGHHHWITEKPPPKKAPPEVEIAKLPKQEYEPTVPDWSELNTSNKEDLEKLLISLIGEGSVNVAELGNRISAYQKNNDLQDTGSKALLKEFGLTGSLNQVIMREFSEKISAEATSFRKSHDEDGTDVATSFEYSVIGE